MPRLVSLILIVFFSRLAFGQDNPLEEAAKSKNDKLFEAFFAKWASEVKPLTSEEFVSLNDTVRLAYNVFSTFYDPITNNAHDRWFDYRKTKYLLIQDKLPIYISSMPVFYQINKDSFEIPMLHELQSGASIALHRVAKDDKWKFGNHLGDSGTTSIVEKLYDTVFSFRPAIKNGGKEILYLQQPYEKYIKEYLNGVAPILAFKDGVDMFRLMKFIARRKKHLDKYLKVWYGWGSFFQQPHMMYDWDMPSYPKVTSITFDSAMQTARVEFMMMDVVGVSLLVKEGNEWKELLYYSVR